jgi:hypothetical protein
MNPFQTDFFRIDTSLFLFVGRSFEPRDKGVTFVRSTKQHRTDEPPHKKLPRLGGLAIADSTATAQSFRNSIGLSVGTFHSASSTSRPPRFATGQGLPAVWFLVPPPHRPVPVNLRLAGGMGTMNPDRFGSPYLHHQVRRRTTFPTRLPPSCTTSVSKRITSGASAGRTGRLSTGWVVLYALRLVRDEVANMLGWLTRQRFRPWCKLLRLGHES